VVGAEGQVKNALRDDIERLRRDAVSARHRHAFEASRARQPALAVHADAASVLATLDDDAEGTYATREALVLALLHEHRASRAAVWASLLLGAFKPMLVRLRGRLISDTMPGDELDQIVVTAFLGSLTEVPLSNRLALRLRQRTERQVFALLRKEREQRHTDIDVEELEDFDEDAMTDSIAPGRAHTHEELYDHALLIQRAIQEGLPTSGLDVVEATVLRREVLRTYVERLGPDDDVTRERLYQRLKRQRSRAMRRLQALLTAPPAPSSPIQLSFGF
jgi:hypothetical protein